MASGQTRQRILEATLECVGRQGFAKTRVEDVARTCGLSRATVYRHFPAGRDQLVRDVISWEAARFFMALTTQVAHAQDLAEVLEETLVFAHRALAAHHVLQKVLETEPEILLPRLHRESPRLVGFVRTFLLPYVAAAPLRPGLEVEEAADFLARLVLSYISAPGAEDLADAVAVRRLVGCRFLSAVE